jgi:hypothetical protein
MTETEKENIKETEITESKETKTEKEEHKCSECDKQAEHQDQGSKKYYCDDHWEELKAEEKESEVEKSEQN